MGGRLCVPIAAVTTAAATIAPATTSIPTATAALVTAPASAPAPASGAPSALLVIDLDAHSSQVVADAVRRREIAAHLCLQAVREHAVDLLLVHSGGAVVVAPVIVAVRAKVAAPAASAAAEAALFGRTPAYVLRAVVALSLVVGALVLDLDTLMQAVACSEAHD